MPRAVDGGRHRRAAETGRRRWTRCPTSPPPALRRGAGRPSSDRSRMTPGDRRLEVVDHLRRTRGPGPGHVLRLARAHASERALFGVPAKASRVDTPKPGNISTTQWRGRSASGYTSSPRPSPSAVPPDRKNGTSAPSAGRHVGELRRTHRDAPQPRQCHQGRGRVGAAAAEAGLAAECVCRGGRPRRAPGRRRRSASPERVRRSPHQVRPIERHTGASHRSQTGPRAGCTRSCRAGRWSERRCAARGSRRTRAEHTEIEVDLRVRANDGRDRRIHVRGYANLVQRGHHLPVTKSRPRAASKAMPFSDRLGAPRRRGLQARQDRSRPSRLPCRG